MKRFIVKILLLILLMFVVDRVGGLFFSYCVDHSKGGYVGHHQYISNELDKEVLVFGSSRAIHHYDAKMIEDSLKMTSYNCGQDGNGAIFNYGQWLMIRERYQPKLIIYDVYPGFDLLEGDNHKYLGWLKLYYNRKGISDIFDSIDSKEKYKMLSKLYQYNYNPVQIVADYIKPIKSVDSYGFRPLPGELDPLQIKNEDKEEKQYVFDELKIGYLEKFISDKGDANIIFVLSPCWYGMDLNSIKPVLDICEREGILFIDYANNPKYVHQDYYFKDGMHLNEIGASEFSKDLVKDIQELQIN